MGVHRCFTREFNGSIMPQNSVGSKDQVLQFVSSSLGTVLNCSTPTIPADDTIPQNTEGTEVLTVTITPKFSTSNLLITFSSIFSISATGSATIALFQDSMANALAAKCYDLSAAGMCGHFMHVMTSGTTSSTTFKIRAGPAANSLYCNGPDGGGQIMGGVCNTLLTVEEYL